MWFYIGILNYVHSRTALSLTSTEQHDDEAIDLLEESIMKVEGE